MRKLPKPADLIESHEIPYWARIWISTHPTKIFQQSLRDGVLPSDWKKRDVTPVFRKGDPAENYRPVSITCVCCKILEHMISSSHIRQHLEQHKILSKFKHGFRKFFSCETQLPVTLQDLLSHRDKNIQIDMAVLDFSKAFYTVPHRRLFGKLSHCGINGLILRQIEAYIENREHGFRKFFSRETQLPVTLQYLLSHRDKNIQIDMAVLNFSKAFYTAPHRRLFGKLSHCGINGLILRQIEAFIENREQGWWSRGNAPRQWGSCLGSHRALCWDHYCSSCTQMICRPLFIHRSNCLPTIVSCVAPSTLSTTSLYQIITLARGRRPFIDFYTLCSHIFESVSDAKYLGILVSNDLSWSPHINSVFNQANSTLGFLRHNLCRCPAPLKETAYITLVRSIMFPPDDLSSGPYTQSINTLLLYYII